MNRFTIVLILLALSVLACGVSVPRRTLDLTIDRHPTRTPPAAVTIVTPHEWHAEAGDGRENYIP